MTRPRLQQPQQSTSVVTPTATIPQETPTPTPTGEIPPASLLCLNERADIDDNGIG